ncbi:MAG: RNA-binding transcriptional accessory protein [SAR324 cluster bacterium]|nr:RNA-binding transcriptional accessory protein [SAR324 cluster bacterium]
MKIIETTQQIAQELNIQLLQIQSTVELLNAGNTIPFIARYRKEMTGNLDETQIEAIQDRWQYLEELEERRQAIFQSIEKQGKLTDALKRKLQETSSKQQLEDLYLPYKPKRRTRAMIAKEKGLEPLAQLLLNTKTHKTEIDQWIGLFLANTEFPAEDPPLSPEQVMRHAQDIIAEMITEHAESRDIVRKLTFQKGQFVSKAKPDYVDQPSKFEMYYDFQEAVRQIPAHRYMALRRGEKENILKLSLEVAEDKIYQALHPHWLADASPDALPYLEQALQDAYHRLLSISIETDIRLEVRQQAEESSIELFSKNLRQLLLQPPGGQCMVLGLDPGYRTGTKWALVDTTGKFIDHGVIYPAPPQKKIENSEKVLRQIIQTHSVKIIAIGNGTASREVQRFVQNFLKSEKSSIICVIVNESGASIYSASEVGREEFPDLDLTVRGAISIARRYQDPLAELVKIDPKSIGVGQYQHDVNASKLQRSLSRTVESCVNYVGVDLNTASVQLLTYVAGITPSVARHVVKHRNQHGSFQKRTELHKVDGIGPRIFEQSAGFLRIPTSNNPLDRSAVHPESYSVVEQMAKDHNISVDELVGNTPVLQSISLEDYVSSQAGQYTLKDILEELKKPGRDPRSDHQAVQFNDGIETINDLQIGMKLSGVVTNMTHFGAFVDVGVHQDGLVHISEMSTRFIKNPMEICSIGQQVAVYVKQADTVRQRIALSMIAPKQEKTPPNKKSNRRSHKAESFSSSDDFRATLAKLEENWQHSK